MTTFDPPLRPRNGLFLLVLIIARISTVHQDRRSLDEQVALCKRYVAQHYGALVEWEIISSQGSGEILDRKELSDAEAKVESGRFDLIIVEDLARICRRNRAVDFCELCEDQSTRLIAINDHIDTGHEGWQLNAFFAAMKHEISNKDTAARIKRSLRERFVMGGIFQCPIYGYNKPQHAKSDNEVIKDKAAEPIYDQWFRMLEEGASYAEVADWLESKGVSVGPYCRKESRWTGSMVGRITFNPILKGERQRNKKESKRVNKTGRHRSVNARPEMLLKRSCPHLAFIEPARYDRLIALLIERNAKYRRKGVQGVDTRKNVPKKRTAWPGQHVDCGVCGRPFVYGGHGQKDHLVCSGAVQYRCWNGFTVDGPLAGGKLIAAVRDAIRTLPDFNTQLIQLVQKELRHRQGNKAGQLRELTQQLDLAERELQNLTAAVRACGHSSSLLDDLIRVEKRKTQLLWDQQELAKVGDEPLVIPCAAEIRRLADAAFLTLTSTSSEFSRLLHRLIPRIVVYPFRLCDGGNVAPRAEFALHLASLLPPAVRSERLDGALQQVLVVDLFEPPQREAYRRPVMELTANGLKQRDIAWKLDITQTAVQRTVALHRRTEQMAIVDPYLRVESPPENEDRFRRHRHPRFHFEPLPGYPKKPSSI